MLEGKAEDRHTEMVDLVKQTASEMMQQSSRLLETERQDRNARAQKLSDSFRIVIHPGGSLAVFSLH